MAISIDTRKAHLSRVHGEVTAIYTWINEKRAMVLAATHRPGNQFVPGAPIYVILEENAYAYDNARQLHDSAVKAAEVLGLAQSAWFKIANIIIEGLPDLIEMPSAPEPEYVKAAIGQMLLREGGKTIAGQDIRLEKEGPTYG